MIRFFLFLVLFLNLLAGCSAKKEVVVLQERKELFVLVPDPDGKVGEIVISNEAGELKLNKDRESLQISDVQPSGNSVILSEKEVQETFSKALQVTPKPEEKYILYFITEQAVFTKESKKQLPQILDRIERRIPCEISIIGYSDTKGTDLYNCDLSLKRAQRIKQQLLAIGVPPKLIQITASGESNLPVPTEDDVIEPKNRRIEIFVK